MLDVNVQSLCIGTHEAAAVYADYTVQCRIYSNEILRYSQTWLSLIFYRGALIIKHALPCSLLLPYHSPLVCKFDVVILLLVVRNVPKFLILIKIIFGYS